MHIIPGVVDFGGAASMLEMTEASFRKMQIRGVGPRAFSYSSFKNGIKFAELKYMVSEVEEWMERKDELFPKEH